MFRVRGWKPRTPEPHTSERSNPGTPVSVLCPCVVHEADGLWFHSDHAPSSRRVHAVVEQPPGENGDAGRRGDGANFHERAAHAFAVARGLEAFDGPVLDGELGSRAESAGDLVEEGPLVDAVVVLEAEELGALVQLGVEGGGVGVDHGGDERPGGCHDFFPGGRDEHAGCHHADGGEERECGHDGAGASASLEQDRDAHEDEHDGEGPGLLEDVGFPDRCAGQGRGRGDGEPAKGALGEGGAREESDVGWAVHKWSVCAESADLKFAGLSMRAGLTMPHDTPTNLTGGPTGDMLGSFGEPQFSQSATEPGQVLVEGLGFELSPMPRVASPSPGSAILQQNLALLSIRNRQLARDLAGVSASADLWLTPTADGVPGGGLKGEDALAAILGTGSGGTGVQLASKYHPLEEARALVETVDVVNAATAVVIGFGLGHHVRVLSERLKEHGAVVVFEPDLGLLRAVMEQIDLTSWMVRGNVLFVTREDDSAAIAEVTRGFETMLTLGTRLVVHPPSVARLGSRAKVFTDTFTDVLKAARTHIVTTLVQTEVTLRNLLQNLDHYAAAPGVEDLRGRCQGKPAIVVSAGPSLARTIEQLAQPGVRDRFVIVAAQTVLKPLLARGIKPHFVTALDHHEISRRFYEGLTAADVEGVTLVAEAKANAAILDAFPGVIRCVGDEVLDRVLGQALSRKRGKLSPGATVAHLAYYVARHLGCDPVILTGQDLGFTDGQYYAAGASIHNVWACELNEFNTLEMMEWERIVRMRGMLRKATDQLGRPIYSDEQMQTYLVQFERDFARDEAAGLTTIDATEGGVAKRHTKIMGMREALASFLSSRGVEPDPLQPGGAIRITRKEAAAVDARLRSLRAETVRLGDLSRQSVVLLRKMLDAKGNQAAIAPLIKKVYEHRDEVQKLDTANWLVHFLNQCGTFRRMRADRAIALAEGLTALEVQTRQIERDVSNVQWLADAADQAGKMLDDASRALMGGPKVTRDDPGREEDLESERVMVAPRRVVATVLADVARSAMGTPRDLSREIEPGTNVLRATLERLASCKELDGILVVTPDVDACRTLAGGWSGTTPMEFVEVDRGALHRHQAAILAGRGWSRECWRGGVAGLTCYDEVCPANLLAPILKERGVDAACLVGGDWAMIDPQLADSIIARYREAPTRNRLAFSQAAPGLAPALVDAALIQELASADHYFASVGGLLRYVPIAPQADPIAKPVCVHVPPTVRDASRRFVVDTDRCSTSAEGGAAVAGSLPGVVRVELTNAAGDVLPLGRVHELVQDLSQRPDACLTLDAVGAMSRQSSRIPPHPHLLDIIKACHSGGIAGVHVRASLAWPAETLRAILDAGVQVLSVEVDDPAGPLEVLDDLHKHREASREGGEVRALPRTWIVPRLTRRDEVYGSVEGFYDACVMALGACVLDPLPVERAGERIQALPLPEVARSRLADTTAVLGADGVWRSAAGEVLGTLDRSTLAELWAKRTGASA